MRTITRTELQRKMQSATPTHVINVLPEESFQKSHIPRSVNIPVGDADFTKKVEQRVGDKKAEVVVYCKNTSCDASPTAAKKLENAGFTNVYDFEGGMEAWSDANETVASGAR